MYDAQVHLYRNALAKEEIFDCSGDGSGHGDGDRLHAYELVTMMEDGQLSAKAKRLCWLFKCGDVFYRR